MASECYMDRNIREYLKRDGFRYKNTWNDFGLAEKVGGGAGAARMVIFVPDIESDDIDREGTREFFLEQLSSYTKAIMDSSSTLLVGLPKNLSNDSLNESLLNTDSVDIILFFYRSGRYNEKRLARCLRDWKALQVNEISGKYPLFSHMIEQDIDDIVSKVQTVPLSKPAK